MQVERNINHDSANQEKERDIIHWRRSKVQRAKQSGIQPKRDSANIIGI
jgi:hypothetical protein